MRALNLGFLNFDWMTNVKTKTINGFSFILTVLVVKEPIFEHVVHVYCMHMLDLDFFLHNNQAAAAVHMI